MDNRYLISPLEDYCNEIDEKNPGWINADYYSWAKNLYLAKPNYMTNLLLADFKFRAGHMLNIVLSIEGQQGCGKSLFGVALAFYIASIFGVAFTMALIFATVSELNDSLRNSVNRSTHILDEQKKKRVGLMSETDHLSLIDYEELGRYTQKNIIYISPEVVDHSHYFVFTYDFLTRKDNKVCLNKKKDSSVCSKGFSINKCYRNKWRTLCKIPFHERRGYPDKFRFLLKTQNKITGFLVPRGFVELPIVSPETVKAYDKVKGINVALFEKSEDKTFDRLTIIANEFIKKHEKKLVVFVKKVKSRKIKMKDQKTGKTKLVPVTTTEKFYKPLSSSIAESMLYADLGSMQEMPQKAIRLIISMIKQKADLMAQKQNEKLK